MDLTKEQLAKAKEAKTFEELLTLAIAENVDATSEEITAFWNSLHAEGELADDELDNVAGGCWSKTYITERPGINSADPRCAICNYPLTFTCNRLFTIDGVDYMSDEYHCHFPRCQAAYTDFNYVHVWEGDRWFSEYDGPPI